MTLLIVSLMVVIGISNAKSKPKPVGNNNQVKVQENILNEKVAEDKKEQKRKYEENRSHDFFKEWVEEISDCANSWSYVNICYNEHNNDWISDDPFKF